VLSAHERHAVLDVDGSERTVTYTDVARAVVQVEFSRIEEVELDEADLDDGDGTPATDADTDPEEG
jgi:hypothetical protein